MDMELTATVVAGMLCCAAALAHAAPGAPGGGADGLAALVGKPADVAPSAYQYRADRKPADNQPESWLAVMRCADLPLNKPVDANAPAVRKVLCALLWEEIRPVRRLELTWPAGAKNRPAPAELTVTTLDNQGTASSWWNNLKAVAKSVAAAESDSGRTYVYDLSADTCGIAISVGGARPAADYAVPAVRALVAETWKKMDVEIEWGYEPADAARDYSGRMDVYDGVAAEVAPLAGDTTTAATGPATWRSAGKGGPRRGIRVSLLYMGTSKWRKVFPFTTQADDVARTIVTLWTKGGSFSFLAADLEHGPILAPEHGFFVRATGRSEATPAPAPAPPAAATGRSLLEAKMNDIFGNRGIRGWGVVASPWFGANATDEAATVQGITVPARSTAMHPGADRDVAVGWQSPTEGKVAVRAKVADGQPGGGDGITWSIMHEGPAGRKVLLAGAIDRGGSQSIPAAADAAKLANVAIRKGDSLSLVVGRRGSHAFDTTVVELVIAEVGGAGRLWDLTRDVAADVQAGNPHADSRGNAAVWSFYTVPSAAGHGTAAAPGVHAPPFEMGSKAASAREFLKELAAKGLNTTRQRIRQHAEQTWQGAVTAMRGANLPPHPSAPAGSEPKMQVQVPCPRLAAQWNLGAWHLTRHCGKNPANGRLWFNDYPYGILAAETYMVLAALDLMGSHKSAEDGFDQWVSLPMNPGSRGEKGHHGWALADRPNGLFSEGHGCLTHAVGPPGAGGHMDGVHAFGPGSIGWALVEHYLLTGDKEWFKAAAPRIKANVEWMLRQRKVVRDMVPGGDRLWCKGLQPALQVTPDSGGLWMQFYECEAYYWVAVAHFAEALKTIDPGEGQRLAAEAESYRKDLLAAVERSITLSPVVAVRDGTYRSVIPFGCYVRGLGTGAWGWKRDGSGAHVGPMYWETVQSALPLVSPAGLLAPDDVRVQGWLDVLEDRLLLENPRSGRFDWFAAGWQYQGGLERTGNVHLTADDIPAFLRSLLNCYAIDILPDKGYVFREHATGGPPDKIFEEAAFLERFRNMLVQERGQSLWLARGTPRAWLQQGRKISVSSAPTHFGTVSYEIVSDADNGRITATVEIPARKAPKEVVLRFRHPKAAPIKGVTINGKPWTEFNPAKETITLKGLTDTVAVTAQY